MLQIHLDTLPELIARSLRCQLQPDLDYRPSSGGHAIIPSVAAGPRPLSEFTGLRRFAGAARQRRPFQTQASFGGFSNVANHGSSNNNSSSSNHNLAGPGMGSDSQL